MTVMQEGLYESVVTKELLRQLSESTSLAQFSAIDGADQAHVLGQHIGQLVEGLLNSVRDDRRTEIANQILRGIRQEAEQVDVPPRRLTRVVADEHGHEGRFQIRPATPLSEAALLTNIKGEPSLGSELAAEMTSADQVDLLCAFVKWHGLRVIEKELRELKDRGAKLRVITTTYIGATERQAIDRLVRDFGAEVRINYNETKTRLHAKAWMFHRNTGFDTAYIGSSNLSRSALLDGLEWNVRLSRKGTPHLLEKFNGTFETYWNDEAFEPYDPDNVADRDRLDDALAKASGKRQSDQTLVLSGLEVRPYPFQQHMLDALEAERELHNRHRNLVVAATGTGKTVVAALDYRGLAATSPNSYPTLLFVAHRQEILEQSRRKYREVLADGSFGELYVGGARPERWKQVFASIQSLNSYGIENIPADAFDVIVVDEFHHASATSYKTLLAHLQPKELLGLTATPERTDGFDVRALFEGRTAAELRLWEALQQGLLCPFHYFMVSDNTDLRQVSWKRGRYDEAELENVYTGNDARTRMILGALQDKVLDPHGMKALGFCVGVRHAQYMAAKFNEAGIPAKALWGETPRSEREQTLLELRSGAINIVFSADLLNEGVDIPDVDTVLFLRPTESATIFLQQLGRGLRQRPDKPVLTVLDFVGNQREEFRFDQRLQGLTGRPRRRLAEDLESGFPFLPSGSQIVLDEQAQELVLRSLKTQISARWPHLIQQLRAMAPSTSLSEFIEETGCALSDVIKGPNKSWTKLQRDAGRELPAIGPQEANLSRRTRAFAHVDDPIRSEAYSTLIRDTDADLPIALREMLFYSLWPDGGGFSTIDEGFASLADEPVVVDEFAQIIDIAFEKADRPVKVLTEKLRDVPLLLHAQYQREEILAGLGWTAGGRKPANFREGVVYLERQNIDAFFITLRKSEDRFSPTTMYRDYPISRSLFHWESQSTTSLASPTGQRYVKGNSTVLLFVREEQKSEFGTAPYICLGEARVCCTSR